MKMVQTLCGARARTDPVGDEEQAGAVPLHGLDPFDPRDEARGDLLVEDRRQGGHHNEVGALDQAVEAALRDPGRSVDHQTVELLRCLRRNPDPAQRPDSGDAVGAHGAPSQAVALSVDVGERRFSCRMRRRCPRDLSPASSLPHPPLALATSYRAHGDLRFLLLAPVVPGREPLARAHAPAGPSTCRAAVAPASPRPDPAGNRCGLRVRSA